MKKLFLAAFFIVLAATVYWLIPYLVGKSSNGPILYGINSGDGVIYKIDPMTCEVCPIMNPINAPNGVLDLVVLPNGNILVQTFDGLRLYDPPNSSPIWSNNITYGGSILAPNGLVYLTMPANSNGTGGMSVYDPATNNITFIGDWPPNIIVSEFFYQGGVLYGVAQEGPSPFTARVIEVNITNPEQSIIIINNPPFNVSGGITNNGYTTFISPSNILRQYDVITNTYITLCTLPKIMGGLSDLPTGVSELPCLCTTFAGTVNTTIFNVCVQGSATVPYNNNATLDGNDILRYILFSDLADTLGSIIVQSSSAIIPFNPATMQTGVIYYLATVAGNNQGGNVDINDPCLDVSNTAAQIIWRPLPAVLFSTANPSVCAGDCTTITATFTGTPPFVLTYINPVTNTSITQTFLTYTDTFELCTPPGSLPGSLTVAATSLADEWCSCN